MQHENGVPCHVNAWHTLQNHEGGGGGGRGGVHLLISCIRTLCFLVYLLYVCWCIAYSFHLLPEVEGGSTRWRGKVGWWVGELQGADHVDS